MLTASTLRGNWGTLLLPINEDDSIDYTRLSEEIDALIAAGVDGIYSNGTAGELHNQSEEEFDRVQALLAARCQAAGMKFQIGVSHPSPLVTLERVRRMVALRPDAFQVILPDWVVLLEEEQVVFLSRVAAEAAGVPLVLYNPPHAKRVLGPEDYLRLAAAVPSLIGVKTGAYGMDMAVCAVAGLSIFVPGHFLASGVANGVASGAYSNVACLSPRGAQWWWGVMQGDLREGLRVEALIGEVFAACVAPVKEKGFSNPALDKMLAAAGGWANVGTRLRWPYKFVGSEEASRLGKMARKVLPAAFWCFLLVLVGMIGRAEVRLPSIIGNNMVLQQQSAVPLWGWARPGVRVTVTTSWNKAVYATVAGPDSNWRVSVKTPAAGGPYSIVLTDGKALVLKNILIGEVWLCSGQSNMEMPVKGFKNQPTLHSNDLLMDADNSLLRLYRLDRAMARVAAVDCKATGWEEASAVSVKEFSAVGYQYAKLLQAQLKVPVGMIMSTWGGTVIEAWMDKPSLQPFSSAVVRAVGDTATMTKNEPTVLFNSMIHPILGYGIRGTIWYQGEQNRPNPQQYDQLMAAMVKEWRNLWGCGEWPFYYVQIAPYGYPDKLGPAAPVREAQGKALKLIPRSGMVVSMDVGEERSIHPADKTTIARRLVYWALADTYGRQGLAYASPLYHDMKVNAAVVTLTFDNALNGLTSFGKPMGAFEVAGEDRRFFPARARLVAAGVALQSDSVRVPVAVRYAYKDWVVGDLYNTEGLPVAPFRTDDW